MKHKVIDNFLDEEYFDSLVDLFTDKLDKTGGNVIMPWFFDSKISDKVYLNNCSLESKISVNGEDKFFYMWHLFYEDNMPASPFCDKLVPLLNKLDTKCLIRVKGNLFPNTHILHEHPLHTDYGFPHSGAILSLNTCDGYTKLKDGTKIDSVANRVLLFDASKEHCSTTTTNVSARINLNINYINVENKIQKQFTIS